MSRFEAAGTAAVVALLSEGFDHSALFVAVSLALSLPLGIYGLLGSMIRHSQDLCKSNDTETQDTACFSSLVF